MTDPENLVLQQLREIRASQEARFSQLGEMLNGILTRLTGIERLLVTLYGLQNEGEQRMKRLEARVDELETYVTKRIAEITSK